MATVGEDSVTQSKLQITDDLAIAMDEITFRFSRASGPGGQNVNRTATRVELVFDLSASPSLSDEQRQHLQERLAGYLDSTGTLRLISQATPSQWRNRQDVLERFRALLARGLRRPPRRVATRPSRRARQARLEGKRRQSQKKHRRRPPSRDEW
jgi:ribosome-associated protein